MAQAMGQVIEKYGPYGSQSQVNYGMTLADGERVAQVIVHHGYVVDAIKFVIAKPGGCGNTSTVQFGSSTPGVSKIVLKDGDYITRISGTHGYDRDREQHGIATMKIHTNLYPSGYGPYALGKNVDNLRDFSSPCIPDGRIVGVFGRHNDNLESIGVYVKREV